jgi:hypothetical protein
LEKISLVRCEHVGFRLIYLLSRAVTAGDRAGEAVDLWRHLRPVSTAGDRWKESGVQESLLLILTVVVRLVDEKTGRIKGRNEAYIDRTQPAFT